jgi:hypothetical protein
MIQGGMRRRGKAPALAASAWLRDAHGADGQVQAALIRAFKARETSEAPYRHWIVRGCLPEEVVAALCATPIPPQVVGGLSGRRELHNDSRHYFDIETRRAGPACEAVAAAFQAPATIALMEQAFGVDLAGAYLRIEYAQDTQGFWLEPHTDLGVKKFSMLYYLAEPDDPRDLGTDLYVDATHWAKRTPFERNMALVFLPSDSTWHGFEPRPIDGVRKSLIINYVTAGWRAREQLAFPDQPVRAA